MDEDSDEQLKAFFVSDALGDLERGLRAAADGIARARGAALTGRLDDALNDVELELAALAATAGGCKAYVKRVLK